MDRDLTVRCLRRLHQAQSTFYAGGPAAPLRDLLSEDIVWMVPGESSIAGTFEGIDAVIAYFHRRRELADRSFTLHPGDVLVGEGDRVAALTDGAAVLNGQEHRWSTIGLYRFRNELICSCRLLPFDQAQFDRIWTMP